MKKLVNMGFFYGILAMCGGVFYREFTKLNQFTGKTTLSVVHTHLFMLGMFFCLIVVLLCGAFPLAAQKSFRLFAPIYHTGVCLTVVMLVVRGIFQVWETPLSKGMDMAISGMAGIGHALTGAGIILLFVCLKKAVAQTAEKVG